ncbi:MAG: AAA family ATPase [Actinophytocola sp.]|nr:AAA family ATPase [Actinophytocola sp.]
MGGFVRSVSVAQGADTGRYPFTLPAVRSVIQAGCLELNPGVTLLVGDNGTGKSTLVEALAVAAGFNPEGGSQSFRFATRATESSLGDALVLRWGHTKPRTGYFLRAESFYNVATAGSEQGAGGGGLGFWVAGERPTARSDNDLHVALA